ncbi:MAG: hypothetical protein K6G25_12955 [Bacteroidales bacterium]|nr:hypothetical protein [Bacteroidales bacterium]
MNNKESNAVINAEILSDECRTILEELLRAYMTPAFGVLPKHEIDMVMYNVLQKVGYLETTSTPYELVRKLKVTRSKAQSLIYESNLRQSTSADDDLKEQLRKLLTEGFILIYNDKVAIEVENPLLRDYIRQCLREVNCITDTSYSKDLLCMSAKAYQKLCEKYANDAYERLMSSLSAEGIEVDDNIKVFEDLIKSLATMAGGEGAGSLVTILSGKIKNVASRIRELREEEKKKEKEKLEKGIEKKKTKK